MARRFKDPQMMKLYTQYRATPPASPRTGGLGAAYFRGKAHPDKPSTLAPRGSLAYAAWAAGVDAARAS